MANIVRAASEKILGKNSVTEGKLRTMGEGGLLCFFNEGSRLLFLYWLSILKRIVNPHHSSKFDFDEDALRNWIGSNERSSKIILRSLKLMVRFLK